MCRKDIDFSSLQADISYLDSIEEQLSESEYQIIDLDDTQITVDHVNSDNTKYVETLPTNINSLIDKVTDKTEITDSVNDDEKFVEVDVVEKDVYDFWTDVDDESDVFDEEPSTSFANKISKDDKALQVAINFVAEKRLDESTIGFLEDVFITFGYGRTKRALSERLDAGHTVEELEAAFWVKSIWDSSSHFGLSFIGTLDRNSGAERKYCSWIQALTLITRLPENISYEEVLDVMENQFDNWYHSPNARKRFPMFIDYLFMHPHPLSNVSCADIGFDYPVGYESIDSDWINHTLHPDTQLLIDYGLYSNRNTELNFEVES